MPAITLREAAAVIPPMSVQTVAEKAVLDSAEQTGESCDHQRKEQNFLESFQNGPPYKESGLEINEPTMLVNRRRHQAFISRRKI